MNQLSYRPAPTKNAPDLAMDSLPLRSRRTDARNVVSERLLQQWLGANMNGFPHQNMGKVDVDRFFDQLKSRCDSPPARWGLLDFMSVAWSSSSSPLLLLSLSSSSRCPPRPPAQLRLAIHSVLCRTSTTTIHAQCSLPDLNHDHPRPVFPAGPQPRPSTPSVPCRTSTTTIHAQCSLPDLNHDHPRPVFPAGPQPRVSTPSVPCRTSTASIHAKRYAT